MREHIIVIQSFDGDITIRRIILTPEQAEELGITRYTTVTEEDFQSITGSSPHSMGEEIPYDIIVTTE